MDKLRVGILSTGKIAGTMAETILQMEEVSLYAVASRTEEKAKAFAEKYGITKAYGSYEELAEDEKIDLVYVATPMSSHYEDVKLLINHGRNVICEKSFALNEKQAREMIDLAVEKGVLLTEAMWVRYMPMWKTIREMLASGIIGEPMTAMANLSYLISDVPRISSLEAGGGAMLDVGVYVMNFAAMVFGSHPEKLTSQAIMMETGVDEQNSTTLIYSGGKMAVVSSSTKVASDRKGMVFGTKGYMIVENINNFETVTVYNEEKELVKSCRRPEQISGYEYEILACKEALEKGWIQCPDMPHEETLRIMSQMDAARAQWGMKYPQER